MCADNAPFPETTPCCEWANSQASQAFHLFKQVFCVTFVVKCMGGTTAEPDTVRMEGGVSPLTKIFGDRRSMATTWP